LSYFLESNKALPALRSGYCQRLVYFWPAPLASAKKIISANLSRSRRGRKERQWNGRDAFHKAENQNARLPQIPFSSRPWSLIPNYTAN
jgi:hypothetical protein